MEWKGKYLLATLPLLALAASSYATNPLAGPVWGVNYQYPSWSVYPTAMVLDGGDSMYLSTLMTYSTPQGDLGLTKILPNGTVQLCNAINGNGYVTWGSVALTQQGNPVVVGGSYNYGHDFDFLTTSFNGDGTQKWSKFYSGPMNVFDAAESVATDSQGSTFVSGSVDRYTSTPKFGLVKYSANGTQVWWRTYAGIPNTTDMAYSKIISDSTGNVYATGIDTVTENGKTRHTMYALKYKADGTLVYATPYNSPHWVEAYDIKFDSAGNAYISGSDVVPVPGQTHPELRLMAMKVSPTGAILWASDYTSASSSNDIAIDPAGNVYVCGNNHPSGSSTQQFLTVKFSKDGIVQWGQTFNVGTYSARAAYITYGADGFLYVCGTAFNGTTYGPMVVKYTAMGALKWYCGCHLTSFFTDEANSMKVDKNGDVFLAGDGQEPSGVSGVYAMRLTQTPVAYPDSFSTSAGVGLNGNVALNDSYASGATVVLQTITSGGKLSMKDDGSFLYSPGVGFSGTDTFSYQLSKPYQGGNLLSNVVTVKIVVN